MLLWVLFLMLNFMPYRSMDAPVPLEIREDQAVRLGQALRKVDMTLHELLTMLETKGEAVESLRDSVRVELQRVALEQMKFAVMENFMRLKEAVSKGGSVYSVLVVTAQESFPVLQTPLTLADLHYLEKLGRDDLKIDVSFQNSAKIKLNEKGATVVTADGCRLFFVMEKMGRLTCHVPKVIWDKAIKF